MTPSAPHLLDAFAASVDAALAVPTQVPLYRALADADFAELSRMSARLQRAAQT